MYEITIKNLKNNSIFIKKIDSPYLFDKFIKKMKYSNKLKILNYVKIY